MYQGVPTYGTIDQKWTTESKIQKMIFRSPNVFRNGTAKMTALYIKKVTKVWPYLKTLGTGMSVDTICLQRILILNTDPV